MTSDETTIPAAGVRPLEEVFEAIEAANRRPQPWTGFEHAVLGAYRWAAGAQVAAPITAAAALDATGPCRAQLLAEGEREITPVEQHIHSFLEVLPLTAVAFTACLHWDQVRSLLRGGDSRRSWRLHPKSRPLPAGYLPGFAAAVLAFVALPYGEELLRCARARHTRAT